MTYLDELIDLVNISEIVCPSEREKKGYAEGIRLLVDFFWNKKKSKSRVFFIGNGGSAAIANHMTADFLKNGGMRTCSLYNVSVLTCLGNDYGYEFVFSKQLEMIMEPDDVLVPISSSGESSNIVRAVETAKQKRGVIVSFTGFKPENSVRKMSDYSIYVPSMKYGMVESIHNLILQQVVDEIMDRE